MPLKLRDLFTRLFASAQAAWPLLIIVAFLLLPHTARADITTGLLGHWNLDEGSGTDAADSSGNGNDGTLQDGPAWVSGHIGAGALDFDGADAAVVAPQPDVTSFTVSAWIKPDSADVGSGGHVIAYKGSATFEHNYFLFVIDGLAAIGIHSGSFIFPDLREPTPTMVAETWNHVVGTYSTAAGGTLTIYVNGVQRNQSTGNGPRRLVARKYSLSGTSLQK